MKLRMITMVILVLSIFLLLSYYIGWHGWVFVSEVFQGESKLRIILLLYWIVFWFLTLSYFISRIISKFSPPWLTDSIRIIGSYWIAVWFYSVIILPFVDITIIFLKIMNVSSDVYVPLLGTFILTILVGIMIVGTWNARHSVIRKHILTINKKAGDYKQITIAVASDLHLGAVMRKPRLKKLVQELHALKPDLILLPGDILDDSLEPFMQQNMASEMSLLHAPLGVYAVLGNHEYYGGHIVPFVNLLKAEGIQILLDESVLVDDSFYLLGRKDKTAERMRGESRLSVSELVQALDQNKPILMMDHQPQQLEKAQMAGIDLVLSGHTHKGQMFPNHWITRRIFELDWGYLRKGNLHVVVSSGYGTWGPPIRIGSRSEIVELTILFKLERE